MLALFTALPSLIGGLFTTVNSITAAISNEKIAQISATTDIARIQSQEVISQLQQQRDVLIADSAHGSWDIWLRTIIAVGPALYIFKIFVIDKVFGFLFHTSTDPLDQNLWNVVMVVLGFYFLSATSTKVASLFAARKS